jgi:PAS domain S-box-containing protein
LIFILQLIFVFLHINVILLTITGLIAIGSYLIFVQNRLNRELRFLKNSIKLLIDSNFSRRLKLHKFPVNDELGGIYEEIGVMLEKVHNRTTEVLLRRKELSETGRNIEQLGIIGTEILSELNTDNILRLTFENLNTLLDASLFAIGIYNKDRNGLNFYGIRSDSDNIIKGFQDLTEQDRWSVYCFTNKKELLFDHYDQNCGKHFSKILFNEPVENRQSFIYLPLIHRGSALGVITVQSFKSHAYTLYHLGILKNIANYVAIAILNAEAFKKLSLQNKELEYVSGQLIESRNILEKRVAERTLELSHRNQEIEKKNIELERLSLVAKKTENAIMIMDAHGNIQWINECFTKIYNYSLEEFIKTRGKNILQTSFNPNIKSKLEECIKDKKPVYYSAPNIKSDGNTIWTHTTLTPVINEDGNITHLLTIDSDVTQLKEYELKITNQSRKITQSIVYAKRIQSAVLPPLELFQQKLNDFFILFKPRDIVSGDFYWFDKKEKQVIIALADCTGHGIPGAFMSILGITLLNEIIKNDDWSSPSKILDKLRINIKKSLRQNHRKYDLADGMDISLCIINTDTKEIKFSGANHSLYIARNNEIVEIKGDKMPIGLHINDHIPFTSHNIPGMPGDRFYLSTDGYIDQFGGIKNKKFMSQHFKEVLCRIQNKSLSEQYLIMKNTIEEWQGNYDQVDDITLVAFTI